MKKEFKKQEYPINLLFGIFRETITEPENVFMFTETAEMEKRIECVLDTFPIHEKNKVKDIILYRYKKKMTLKAIGDIYGITRQRVRQIENRILRIIRNTGSSYIKTGTWS